MPQKSTIKESPLFWPAKYANGTLHVLDETRIPEKLTYIPVKTVAQAVAVIRQMKTRAFGQLLVVMYSFLLELDHNKGKKLSAAALLSRLEKTAQLLNKSRPTFPFAEVTSMVTGWARKAAGEGMEVGPFVRNCIGKYLSVIRERRLERVKRVAELLKNKDSVLTHCNVSGELAMAAHIAIQKGRELHFFVTETRPYFQGAKLTAWELKRLDAKVTLIADNAVGSVMADGLVNKVIVGSDRSCANGDFANKIGTYQIAVLAREFGLPFYVLTQPSNRLARGEDIPVEIRPAKEFLNFGGKKIISEAVQGFYPGFDVVPVELVTAAVAIETR